MTKFVHIHSSSRFDRSEASLTAAATKYNKDADLVTYTEVEFENREKAVRKANGKEFGFVSGDEGHANDSVISYRKSRFKLVYSEMFKNSDQIIFTTAGHQRDLPYTTIAVFDDLEAGKRFVVAVSHYASSVESELAKNDQTYRRAIQWRQSTKNSKRRVNQLARKYKADARLVIGDWNVDFKKAWVRALVKAIAPSYTLTWKNVNVAGGTHGRRIIDATILRGKLSVKGSAELYPDDPSSDHRPYREVLVWDLTSK